ncbi:MAG: sensor histidine kinase [Fluviicola sp.]|nr:sensor histidine kinase [Fluviicola sp.]
MKKISFHFLFWIFIALYVFDYVIDLYDLKYSILFTLFETAIYALVFYVNLLVLLPLVLEKKGKLLYAASLSFLFAITYGLVVVAGLKENLLSSDFARSIASFLLNNSLFIVIAYFVWYFNKFEQEKQKRLQTENEKLQSELLFLKSQINPHFLFNSLNNIYTLTLLKNDNAPKMLAALSEILRYFIYEGNKETVFLDAEIEVISKYIELQKYRQIVGMNNIHSEVVGSTSGLKVPPLLFITLIENAFKHSDIIEDATGFVDIRFNITEDKIEFKISNSYHPKEKSEGIGLKNVESQLAILYGENYVFNVTEENNNFTINLCLYGS